MKKINLFLALCSVFAVTSCGNKDVTRIEVCDDTSNAIRAVQLLVAKNVITAEDAATFYNNETLAFTGSTWTSKDGKVEITLIAENLLVSSLADYDYACLPCNTAYTGNVDASKRVAVEDDPSQVSNKANILAARKADYETNDTYATKIDLLADALLSKETSDFFNTKYLGAMTCDSSTQIDLRTVASKAANTISDKTIKVCASDVPHAEVLEGAIKPLLAAKGYDLKVTILDWTIQNEAVSKGDYDANYFQHVPYLETYTGSPELFAVCKVHYEPLGIYSLKHTSL